METKIQQFQQTKAKKLKILQPNHIVTKVIIEIYLILSVIPMFIPFAYMLVNAMKTSNEIMFNPFSWPKNFPGSFIANLKIVFSGEIAPFFKLTDYWTMFGNTLFMTVFSLLFMILFAMTAGYAMARFQFIGKGLFLAMIMVVQTVPLFAYMWSLYMGMNAINAINNRFWAIPVYVSVSVPMTIILFQSFYKSFPKEIEEAACIDGCSEFQKFFRIVFPLTLPTIAALCAINFMGYWNEFAITQLLVGTKKELRTLNLGIFFMEAAQGQNNYLSYSMCLLLMSAIPNLIFFMFFQKYITGNVTLGAVKG